MRHRFVSPLGSAACCVALTLVANAASAQSHTVAPVTWGSPRIDPRITTLIAHRTHTGETLPAFRRSMRFEREGTFPVVIRFGHAPAIAELTTLAHSGVVMARGGAPLFSGAYSARVDATAITTLEADSNVVRVEIDLPLRAPRPLDLSVTETHIAEARRALIARDGTMLDGHGIVIGDVDTGLFVYHPALFHADAGSFPWVDVNRDGHLAPGIDGVDLDHDGTISPAEVLRLLPANAVDVYQRPFRLPGGAGFHPDRDWLYLDTDGSGSRDFGSNFQETDPAYGEPLFVLDDANRDGTAQQSEHLWRLGTSKIRAVLASSPYLRGGTDSNALIFNDPGSDAAAYETVFHGTGVAGILVSGVPGVSRFLGLAPGADLIVADDRLIGDSTGTMGALQWEMDQGANILLTEYAPYSYVTLDGSSEEELLLDSALTHNVVPVSPAGNLAQARKHRHVHLVAGDNSIIAQPDASFGSATLIQISLHDRSPNRAITFSLTLPDGTVLAPPPNVPSGRSLPGGYTAYTTEDITAHATHEHHVLLYRRSGFPVGDCTIHFTLDAGDPLDADLYVGDDVSSWSGGFQLEGNDESRTLCHPATSDHTIAVAAYVLHDAAAYGPWGAVGERAQYSSQGPRIDGDNGIDIAAPDNPLSLVPMRMGDIPAGSYSPFGGTSGAGPHVAASVALLRQLRPAESAETIRARIVDHARTDDLVFAGGPTLFGAGRLDVSAAGELLIASGDSPRLTLVAPSPVLIGSVVDVNLQVVDDEPASELRARWDLDSDGHPDTDWVAIGPQRIETTSAGAVDVRVEVHDGQGNLSATSMRIEIAASIPMNRDAGVVLRSVQAGGGCGCHIQARNRRPHWPRWIAMALLFATNAARRRRARLRQQRV